MLISPVEQLLYLLDKRHLDEKAIYLSLSFLSKIFSAKTDDTLEDAA